MDGDLAIEIAKGVGVPAPDQKGGSPVTKESPNLNQERPEHMVKNTIKTRKIAILVADGYNHKDVSQVMQALEAGGAKAHIISKHQGVLTSSNGAELEVDKSFITTASVLYDAVYVPGGKESINTLKTQGNAIHFVNEAFKHCKSLGATGEVIELFKIADLPDIEYAGQESADTVISDKGVVTARKGNSSFNDLLLQLQSTVTGIEKRKNRLRPEIFERKRIPLFCF